MATPGDEPTLAQPFIAGSPLCVAWTDGGVGPFAMLATGHSDGRIVIRNADDLRSGRATVLTGHTGWVWSVGWSPDGTRIASCGDDGTVKVWNPDTGEQTTEFTGHTGWVRSVGWSPDGTRIASCGDDGTVKVWNPDTGEQTTELTGHTSWVRSVGWSPDGTRIASGSTDGTVKVWNPDTGEQTTELTGHTSWVNSVAWSPDGTRIASGSTDGTVKVWNPDTGEQTTELTGHTSWVNSVAWSPDGTRIASGSTDGTVKVWNPDTGEQTTELTGHTSWVRSVGWSPDGTRIASCGDDGTVKVWNPDTGEQTTELTGHTSWVRSVAWSPDGTRIASGSTDGTVKVWNPDTGKQTTELTGHTGPVRSVGWSPDGTRIASGSDDGTVKVWNPHTGEQTTELTGHTSWVRSVGWSPDGTRIASGSTDGTVKVWNPHTGEQTTEFTGHTGPVRWVGWSPDGTRIASGSTDGTVKVWNPDTGKQTTELTGHTSWVNSVAWSPDGTRIASGSTDGTVKVWNPDTGEQTTEFTGHTSWVNSVAWSPDGTRIASGSDDGTVKVWNPDTGTEIHGVDVGGPVTAVAWRPRPAGGDGDDTDDTLAVWGGWLETVTLSADGAHRRPFAYGAAAPLAAPDGWPTRRSAAAAGLVRPPVAAGRSIHDQPALVDLLSRASLAAWLSDTVTSLAAPPDGHDARVDDYMLVLDAPWGSGKTTLVNLVCQTLANPTGKTPDAEPATTPTHTSSTEWVVPPAPYDAWRRGAVGPTWWSLVSWLREVALDQTPSNGLRWRRGWFRVREAWARVRHGRSSLWTAGGIVLAIGAAAVVGLAGGWLSGSLANTPEPPAVASTTVSTTGAAAPPTSVAASPPANTRLLDSLTTTRTVVEAIAAITAVGVAVWFVVARIVLWYSPLGARLLQRRDGNPMDEIVCHARWLRQQLRGPLLWVIDDLDRCSADDVVDLLETVQTILRAPEAVGLPTWLPAGRGNDDTTSAKTRTSGGPVQPLVFVVAADARWISRAFEHRFGETHGALGEPGRTLGSLFLDKLFQLRVTLPTPSADDLERFDRTTLNAGAPRPGHAGGTPTTSADNDASSMPATEPPAGSDSGASAENAPGTSDHDTDRSAPAELPVSTGLDRPTALTGPAPPAGPTEPTEPTGSAQPTEPTESTGSTGTDAPDGPPPFPTVDRLRHIIETQPYDVVLDFWDQLPAEHKAGELAQVLAQRDSEAVTSGEAEHLLMQYMRLVEPNPRTRKRLVNTWSANTAALRPIRDVNRDHLVRWSIIDIRWPDFARTLRDDPELIDRVEPLSPDGSAAPTTGAPPRTDDIDSPEATPHDPWASTLASRELRRIVHMVPGDGEDAADTLTGAHLRDLFGLPH